MSAAIHQDVHNILTIYSLDIPETTLFDMWAKQRNAILSFCEKYPQQANECMESVVRVITLTGTRTKKYASTSNADAAAAAAAGGGILAAGAALPSAGGDLLIRRWRSMRGRNNKGRFIPDMDEPAPEPTPEEIAAAEQEEKSGGHEMQPTDEAAADSDATANAARAATQATTLAPSSSAVHSASTVPTNGGLVKSITGAVSGLFKSKQKPAPRPKPTLQGTITIDGYEVSGPADALIEESDSSLDTEVNLQLGDFTLKSSRLEVLNEYIKLEEYEDYMAIFGRNVDSTPMQCAEVRHTSHRQWFRLVGRRHDVLFWDADRREIDLYPNYTRSYDSSSEGWIVQALEPIKAKFLEGMKLYLPHEWYPASAPYAMLQAVATKTVEEKAPLTGNTKNDAAAAPVYKEYKTLHEIVVFQKQRVVHIYSVSPEH